jgi:periplasmic divalent cation tolerance protein
MNDAVVFCYTTAPEWTEAEILAQTLVEKKLIACANLIPQMTSIYEWQGQITKSHETVILLKTRKSLWEPLRIALTERHPYKTPCLVEIPIDRIHKPFETWILEQTSTK